MPVLPAITLVSRTSDNGEVLKITGMTAVGAVGDYFGAGVMTPVEGDAVNLRGNSMQQAIRATTAASGLYTWTYPIAFANGVVPIVDCCAEGPDPQAGVTVNAQLEGVPTNTSCKIRVTRTASTVVALIGLTILSISTSVATVIHIRATNP